MPSPMTAMTDLLLAGTYRIEATAVGTAGTGFGAIDGVEVPPGERYVDTQTINIAF